MAPSRDPLGDASNLGGTFPQSKDDFGEALPGRAVVIDFCKAQIFERLGLIPTVDLQDGLIDRQFLSA